MEPEFKKLLKAVLFVNIVSAGIGVIAGIWFGSVTGILGFGFSLVGVAVAFNYLGFFPEKTEKENQN